SKQMYSEITFFTSRSPSASTARSTARTGSSASSSPTPRAQVQEALRRLERVVTQWHGCTKARRELAGDRTERAHVAFGQRPALAGDEHVELEIAIARRAARVMGRARHAFVGRVRLDLFAQNPQARGAQRFGVGARGLPRRRDVTLHVTRRLENA